MITIDQLLAAMPGLTRPTASEAFGPMLDAMTKANISTPLRAAHWLAQLGHESGSLRWMQEIASGKAYENRKDLGNIHPGDGPRFKGHGPIQITGRANHRAATLWMHAHGWIPATLDFEAVPNLLATLRYGFLGAAWFWTTHGLNAYADQDDVVKVTRIINGGTNGLDDRKHRLALAKAALAGKP